MTTAFLLCAPAPTCFVASPSGQLPEPQALPHVHQGQIKHLLFGTLSDVNHAIAHLHMLGYANPSDWSRPLATGRANEVMSILVKRTGTCQ